MDAFIAPLVAIVKLIYNLIEGVIRALIDSFILIACYIILGASSIVLGLLILRFGYCGYENCFPKPTVTHCVTVAGISLFVYIAYVMILQWF
ncbi:hypothetical protein HW555_001542 [Spodoptera exigua]|uniref:Uncharacterized protein n=1 Tax=Spodoptera exigua TaxID=7107 RepID=A0A835GU47_SPOEX|nr:hypothetical protein HW555_001542 [Spodoptera exigua]